ncbi:hypothetical protein [Raoultibacter timonensis]|uniref:hypothetical protein n=1 Tax=Raoultibacter timonensis TaxID=1907662 RepID=UPI001FCB8F88|nr:hypothetical protein [Raoultibacter timonensis]
MCTEARRRRILRKAQEPLDGQRSGSGGFVQLFSIMRSAKGNSSAERAFLIADPISNRDPMMYRPSDQALSRAFGEAAIGGVPFGLLVVA